MAAATAGEKGGIEYRAGSTSKTMRYEPLE